MTATALTASPALPRRPDGATMETARGAQVAGQYWFDVLNFAVGAVSSGQLRAISGPSCDACTAIENTITDAYRGGGSMRGGQYVVRSRNLDSFFILQGAIVWVVFDRSPRTMVDAEGSVSAALSQATFAPCRIIPGFAGGQWWVVAVQSPDPVG
jgi:hypothetical protein